MGGRPLPTQLSSLRSLPRCFLEGADPAAPITLPEAEFQKFHRVLRLQPGDEIGILPNDGSIIRCHYKGRIAEPIGIEHPNTESPVQITVAQALPKADKLDEIIRACSELGASAFCIFPSERSVPQWDQAKIESKLGRLRTIAKEAAEVSFRVKIPTVFWLRGLEEAVKAAAESQGKDSNWAPGPIVVLSEWEAATKPLTSFRGQSVNLFVGPEGGWSALEREKFTDCEVTMGPRVLRVDHAAPAALAALLVT